MNMLLLNALGFPENEYLTFKQVQDLGGRVKKGEKANLVVLWVWINEDSNKRMQEVKGRKRPLLRYYFVFNSAQCTGLPTRAAHLETKPNNPIEKCEGIVASMPNRPKIVHNENEAYYHPHADFINMPKMQMFESSQGYYATLFHELIHSTGYEGRLNRKELMDLTKFGSESYSSYVIQERDISIDEVIHAYHEGKLEDMFGTGTAAVVSHIGEFHYKGENYELPPVEGREISNKLKSRLISIKSGKAEDIFNWLHAVPVSVYANQ
jgi:antirestriction protein ArdC